ncbi:hypothetical protein QCD79_34360, partial [Pseudomonas quasicaspiana]|nr:hypothetical protein [Pseudomonas quasicaspiana]
AIEQRALHCPLTCRWLIFRHHRLIEGIASNHLTEFRNFAELSEVIRRNPFDQPMMAKYQPATGQWAVEGPL